MENEDVKKVEFYIHLAKNLGAINFKLDYTELDAERKDVIRIMSKQYEFAGSDAEFYLLLQKQKKLSGLR